jgi:hypothetical protein
MLRITQGRFILQKILNIPNACQAARKPIAALDSDAARA